MSGSPTSRPPVDRSRPPAAGDLRPFRFPSFEHVRLDNGLEVYAARSGRAPLARLETLMPAGAELSLGHSGLAGLHGDLLDEGSARHSAMELAMAVEALGGFLSTGAGWNVAYVDLGLLAQHLDAGLELMTEIVRTPTFPEHELERLRRLRLTELLRRKDQPQHLAEQWIDALIYRDTVYGQGLIGQQKSLEGFTLDDIQGFYRQHVRPNGASVIAIGDTDPDLLVAKIEQAFGDWTAQPDVPQPEIEPHRLSNLEVHIVDRPESAQTQLVLGHHGLPRAHPDFAAVRIMNAILGGQFTSRINLNLRERHGFTYSAQSMFLFRRGPGPFRMRAAVATDVAGQAAKEMLFEVRKLREELPSDEEVRDTRHYLAGIFPYTMQTIGDLAKRLEALAIFGLGDDYYQSYPANLLEVTPQQVLAAAQAHLHPDHMAVVAVGPAKTLRPQLEDLGPVRVVTPEEVMAGDVGDDA